MWEILLSYFSQTGSHLMMKLGDAGTIKKLALVKFSKFLCQGSRSYHWPLNSIHTKFLEFWSTITADRKAPGSLLHQEVISKNSAKILWKLRHVRKKTYHAKSITNDRTVKRNKNNRKKNLLNPRLCSMQSGWSLWINI